MSTLRIILLGGMLVACLFSPAQGQEEYEDILEAERETNDQSKILERLDWLREHPLDLNRASAQDLEILPWITPVQARQIVQHRGQSGRFNSLSGLLAVPGIDGSTVRRISPFLTVMAKRPRPSSSGRLLARVLTADLPDKISGKTPLFGEKVLVRGEVSILDRVTVRLLTEKDPGEPSLGDCTAGSAMIQGGSFLDRTVLGQYGLDFGQGLVLGSYSGSCAGSAYPSSLKKRDRGPGLSCSASEASPLFGVACSGSWRSATWSLFLSRAKLDATLNSDGTVSSIYETGLHRTQTEAAKKDNLQERLWGGHLALQTGRWGSLGATFFQSRFDRRFQPLDLTRRRYEFRGQGYAVGGVHADLVCRRLNLFGEVAKSSVGGGAMLLGCIVDQGTVELDAILRSYACDFCDLHNCAFAQDPDATQNEIGALLGFLYRPDARTRIVAYLDRWVNPWRRYYEKMPVHSEEWWSQAERRFSSLLATVRLGTKSREVDEKREEGGSKNTPRRQVNGRGQLDWQLGERFRWRTRLERVWVQYPLLSRGEIGWLVFVDLRCALRTWMTLENRFSFFRTDSYESRIYVYESDLPGAMTNVGLFGQGMRWYAVLKGKIGGTLQISLKYGLTRMQEEGKEDEGRFACQVEFTPRL